MMEPLFGSTAPMWAALPSPGFGFQSPVSFSNAPIASPAAPVSFPALPGAAAVTAPALLTAVAVRRGQPQGPTTDQDIEDFIFDAFELLPGTADVEVRCDGGKVMMTGTVSHKRIKRDAGEVAWAIPVVNDVQNNLIIQSRRRTRSAGRETETPSSGSGRKQG